MTATAIDPTLDLTLNRVIRAPREAVWRAWTDPELLAQWWLPAPAVARVERLDVRPGGAMVTQMSEDGGAFVPHLDATFLVVEEGHRLVFTNAIDSGWRPTLPEPVAMTAEIVFGEHPEGTDYLVVVRHANPQHRNSHEEMGFFDGWGSVTDALATLVESGAAS